MPVPSVSEGETAGPLTIELTALQPGEDAGIQLAGIGMQFEKRGDYFVVTRVIPGGGAAEMGLGPGDELTAINGLPAKAMTFADAVPLLRGPEGTTVTLVVLKGGNPQDIVTVAVPRRVITA
jgi:C-terminal processing protease CtpA/Prc